MVSWLPSIPYEPTLQSIWEPATSTINFCEEDFYLTGYVAEVMNVATNILYLWFAVKGALHVYKHEHPKIFAYCFVSYGIIGMGSIMFHGTLKYSMQLVDECAMIYTALTMCFATFAYGRSLAMQVFVFITSVSIGLAITLIYHYLKNPLFHQNAFALIMITLLARSMYLMETVVRQKDREATNVMWKMVLWGSTIFLTGFGVWNLDNIYCQQLRGWRRSIGMPWGFVLELHAWWHLLTGTGSYILLIWGEYLRVAMDDRIDDYVLVWPSLWYVPSIDRKDLLEDKIQKKKKVELVPLGEVKATNGAVKEDEKDLLGDKKAKFLPLGEEKVTNSVSKDDKKDLIDDKMKAKVVSLGEEKATNGGLKEMQI